jgi:hypothetical protein
MSYMQGGGAVKNPVKENSPAGRNITAANREFFICPAAETGGLPGTELPFRCHDFFSR